MTQPGQPAPTTATVTLRVGQDKHTGARKTFERIVEFMTELLNDAKTPGEFVFIPVEGVRGGSARKGFRVTRVDPPQGLYCSIQLDGNDSAWQFRLAVPKTMRPEYVLRKIEAVLKAREHSKPKEAHRMPPQEAATPPAEPRSIVNAALDDLESLALALAPMFPLRSTQTMHDRVILQLCKEFAWEEPVATQVVQALTNRSQLEMRGTGDLKVVRVISESGLASHLVTLDALKVPITASATTTEARKRGRPTNEAKAARAAASSATKPVASEPPPQASVPYLREVAQVPVPPTPPSPSKSRLEEFKEMERMAQTFERSQRILKETDASFTAMSARVERARADLNLAEQELANINQRRSVAARIVSDEAHIAAASKYTQYRKLMGYDE